MKHKSLTVMRSGMVLVSIGLFAALVRLIWTCIPWAAVRGALLALCVSLYAVVVFWAWYQRRQVIIFADDICQTLDALMSGRQPEGYRPYEDSVTARVQRKLIRYFDIMNEGKIQSQKDKETIQGLVSDISHQVKTPIANLQLYTSILQNPQFPPEKREEFMRTMEEQINKLDFLLQSLIKMSRLETGTFTINIEDARLGDTIARAMSTVWARAEEKQIQLSADCDSSITVRHDPKWTAEALGNILDNAVKYTPEGGSVTVTVRPWQFYTKIDITDTGIGIEEEHYNDIFLRFYRAPEAAACEGVGLGLYLANGIITRQRGYISVKSRPGAGTTFSVYLLS